MPTVDGGAGDGRDPQLRVKQDAAHFLIPTRLKHSLIICTYESKLTLMKVMQYRERRLEKVSDFGGFWDVT